MTAGRRGWEVGDDLRFEAHEMISLLAVQGADANPLVVREARGRLVTALAGLMDLPAYSDIHGQARDALERLATLLKRPGLRLPE